MNLTRPQCFRPPTGPGTASLPRYLDSGDRRGRDCALVVIKVDSLRSLASDISAWAGRKLPIHVRCLQHAGHRQGQAVLCSQTRRSSASQRFKTCGELGSRPGVVPSGMAVVVLFGIDASFRQADAGRGCQASAGGLPSFRLTRQVETLQAQSIRLRLRRGANTSWKHIHPTCTVRILGAVS